MSVTVKIGGSERVYDSQEQADQALRQHEEAVQYFRDFNEFYWATISGQKMTAKERRETATSRTAFGLLQQVLGEEVDTALKPRDQSADAIRVQLLDLDPDDCFNGIIERAKAQLRAVQNLLTKPDQPLAATLTSRSVGTKILYRIKMPPKMAQNIELSTELATVVSALRNRVEKTEAAAA